MSDNPVLEHSVTSTPRNKTITRGRSQNLGGQMKHMLRTIAPNTAPPGQPFNTVYECVDCLVAFDYWPSDNMPDSECPGEPTPVTQAIYDATTGMADVIAKALGIEEDTPQ